MPFSAPQMQRRWKSLPAEPVGDAGDAYTGYDRFGRVERMRWGKLGDGGSFSPLVDVSWGHSPASQKTWRKDSLAPVSTAQDQKFDYDALYQLTQRQRGVLNVNLTSAGGVPAQQEDFAYDETGNWKGYRQQASGASVIEQSRVNNQSNQITQVDGSSAGISYDANGNMLTVPTGEALTNPSNRIVWDGWNRPVKVYDAADTLLAEYRYDGLGRRITVTSGGVTRHTYYDDQWRSIEERIDDATTPERQHIWHPNDRWEMILRDRSTANNGVMDERLYPIKDQLDPVALADDTGNVVERISYTAFGIPTFLDSSFNPQAPTHAWDFLFHAEFQDAETGWFNYGYRYYATMMGRWLSRDPIGERGGRNLYSMVGNDAVDRIDKLGLVELPILDKVGRIIDQIDRIGSQIEAIKTSIRDVKQDANEAIDRLEGFLTVRSFREAKAALEAIRTEGHQKYPGVNNDSTRHCWASCEASKRVGERGARLAGQINEAQGILVDIRNLQTGAFELEDLDFNELGFGCAKELNLTCEECCGCKIYELYEK